MTEENLRSYADFFETLDRDSLTRLSEVMTEDIRFKDPFNDVTGIEDTAKIFSHMFENLGDPRFSVTDFAIASGDPSRGFLLWQLTATLRNKPYRISGMSEVRISADGRISLHIDHWDAAQQFYEHLPLVGGLLRTIRSRLKI